MMDWIWGLPLLAVLASIFVIYPLLVARPRQDEASQRALNIEIYQARVQELEQDLARGVLSSEHFAAAKQDLDRMLVADVPLTEQAVTLRGTRPWVLGFVLVLFVVVGSAVWYRFFGAWEPALQEAQRQAEEQKNRPALPEDFAHALESLDKRLRQGRGVWQEWLILAQSFTVAQRFADARRAYASAYQLTDGALPVPALLDYVEVLLITDSDPALPALLLERVLAEHPNEVSALWFAGLVAMQQNRFSDALGHFYRLLALEPGLRTNLEMMQVIQNVEMRVDEAVRARLQAEVAALSQNQAESSPSVQLTVAVSLSDALKAMLTGDETVFIFAQLPEGSRMPLAIVRMTVKDLPAQVILDDHHAMVPEMRLSKAEAVRIGARISKSGQAIPQPGDWEVFSEVLALPHSETVVLVIQDVRETAQ